MPSGFVATHRHGGEREAVHDPGRGGRVMRLESIGADGGRRKEGAMAAAEAPAALAHHEIMWLPCWMGELMLCGRKEHPWGCPWRKGPVRRSVINLESGQWNMPRDDLRHQAAHHSLASSIHPSIHHLFSQRQERHQDTRQRVAHPLPPASPTHLHLHLPRSNATSRHSRLLASLPDGDGHETLWAILTPIFPVFAPGTVVLARIDPPVPLYCNWRPR